MSFNLFAPPSKDDIRVGYIDPTLGYVSDATICEVNEYAKNNPGTTFIFKDGDNNIKYLNINEVNRLTPNDLKATKNDCEGIQAYKECGPPRIQLFGGGGVGAVGNPVVGRDGSLLAVDLVSGGNGYQYPPIVAAKDDCQFGNGAVLTAVLGETADAIEVFEGEEDFEEYEICEDTDVGYGERYGPDGEELGPWEPQTYTKIGEDPIKREIELYQKILKSPFWTTKQNKPDRITALGKSYPQAYNVTRPETEWGDFMNKYAISPVKPSNTTGTDEAGKIFSMEWEQNFPITGEYIFRGVCDKIAQVYIDDALVGNLKGPKQNPSPLQKTILEGNHIIRVDLQNVSSPYKFRQGLYDTNSGVLGQTAIRNAISDGLSPEQIREEAARQGLPLNENAENLLSSIPQTSSSLIVSSKSWQENPMGVSMIIEPPEPVIPQEQPPVQTGKCPPNPIWSTRFPGSSQKWYPVRYQFDYRFKQGPNDTNSGQLGATAINNALADGLSPDQIKKEAARQGYTLNQNAQKTLAAASSSNLKTTSGGRERSWSKFMNRYAVSPVLPLDTPGSDSSGVSFSNTWEIDLPYSGFYGVKGTRDNSARILIDSTQVSTLDNPSVDNPRITKIFLEKGRHSITVELLNEVQGTPSVIDTKIFSTKDWRILPKASGQKIDIDFDYRTVASSTLASYFRIPELDIDIYKPARTGLNQTIPKKVEVGKVYTVEFEVPQTRGSVSIKADGNSLVVEDLKSDSARDLFLTASNGKFFDVQNGKTKATCKFTVEGEANISQSVTKNGVTYDGPGLFAHNDSRWSKYMNNQSVSPKVFSSISQPESPVVGKYTLSWKNVNFPENGIYKFSFQADSNATFKVGGRVIYKTSDFVGEKVEYTFNATAGKNDIVVELENVKSDKAGEDEFIFQKNPMGVALKISKDISLSDTSKTSWTDNPMAVSAILIPPPCSKKIGGKGVVEKVIIDDPGNGYLPPQGGGYPATLVLEQVIVENPGINYRCGEDQIVITPNNGAELSYDCDPFGKIKSVKVLNGGSGFNIYPEISMPSETGVNASFRPVFRVIRDPLLPPEKLIQVTDLVGLKQTGYVDGRAYYGAVYYDEGVSYAGYYKTAGTQIQVYNTLQESITARVTTPASAIQRSGTDIQSNDPKLNIPGTPESTTQQF